MDKIFDFSFKQAFGISPDAVILVLLVIIVILIVVVIISTVKTNYLQQTYNDFLVGRDGGSLEDTLIRRIDQMDRLETQNEKTQEILKDVLTRLNFTYQKTGLVKYDAFDEMGGKLSFTLAMLNRRNTGFVLNAMHSREGCYTYVKEIINGNPVLLLSAEEREAVEIAMRSDEI